MKKFILAIALIFCMCIQVHAKNWLFVAYDGISGGTAGKADNIDACDADGSGYDLQNKDALIVWDQTAGVFYFYIWNNTSTATDDNFSVVTPDACNGGAFSNYNSGAGRWLLVSPVPREFKKLDLTTDTTMTEAQILANKYISNQGAAGEVDLTLPAVSYAISVVFSVEEVLIIEVNPPSGELFDLNGTLLDANDCVDSPAIVGSKLVATRLQNAAGTWIWSLDAVRGTWVDTGASD